MSGTITFRVVDKDVSTLRREIIASPENGDAVEFHGASLEDPWFPYSQSQPTAFKFRLERAEFTEPETFGGRDEISGGWLFITIHKESESVEFTLYTP